MLHRGSVHFSHRSHISSRRRSSKSMMRMSVLKRNGASLNVFTFLNMMLSFSSNPVIPTDLGASSLNATHRPPSPADRRCDTNGAPGVTMAVSVRSSPIICSVTFFTVNWCTPCVICSGKEEDRRWTMSE